MSGRLVILPKKSYCPWKPENVERVLRDERIEKERLEALQEQEQKDQSQQRLKTLKRKQAAEAPSEEGHVNLFEKEERQMVQKSLTGEDNGAKKKKNQGVMPVVLGGTELKNRGDNAPFYLRNRTPAEGTENDKEKKRRATMDPMHRYAVAAVKHKRKGNKNQASSSIERASRTNGDACGDEDYSDGSHRRHRERKREKKHDKTKRSKRKRNDDSARRRRKRETCSMDDLRRRRAEREQQESLREASLRQAHDLHASKNSSVHYQDQYNPGLSRN